MKTKELCIHGLLIGFGGSLHDGIPDSCFRNTGLCTPGGQHDSSGRVFFGARYGMVAGGIGLRTGGCSDGYSHWAPFTLIIKVCGLADW